ncbi:MAG: hypothetical protein ACQERB_09870 [Promethearchaeati archaeon]
MSRISINWRKAEGSPKSKQKVSGRELLDLRERISKLEEQNFKKDEKILILEEKLKTTESSFKDIINKAELAEKNLKIKISLLQEKLERAETQIQKQQKRLANVFGGSAEIQGEEITEEGVIGSYMKGFDNVFGEFNNLRNEVDELKLTHFNEFKINKYEISQVNERLDNLISIFEETIPETNKEIERLKEDLMVKDEQIRITKENLDEAIITKDSIIEKLEKDLEAKIEEINDLNNTVDALYTQMSEFKNIPKIIRKIKNFIKENGSITEKELKEILEKRMEQQN